MTREQTLAEALILANEVIAEKDKELKEKESFQIRIAHTYENKTQLGQTFGVTVQCIRNWYPEFESVVQTGRYGPYAILDGMTNVAAFADFIKYKKWFRDANLRKHIPIFRLQDAISIIIPEAVAK